MQTLRIPGTMVSFAVGGATSPPGKHAARFACQEASESHLEISQLYGSASVLRRKETFASTECEGACGSVHARAGTPDSRSSASRAMRARPLAH